MQPCDTVSIASARLGRIRTRRDGEWLAAEFAVESGPEDLQRQFISVSGVLPGAATDRYYRLELQFTPHPKFGDQYKIISAQAAMPMTRAGLAAYMKQHIHGIGQKRAAALIEAFGVDLPQVLVADDAVKRVCGTMTSFPKSVAAALIEEWRQVRDRAALDIALYGAGCSPGQIARMHDRFGDGLSLIAQGAPYRLMEVRGVGFKQADAVATHFGYAMDDPLRCLAAMAEVVRSESRNGHCWTSWEQALTDAAKLINLPSDQLANITEPLLDQPGELLLVCDDRKRLWPIHLHTAHRHLVAAIGSRRHLRWPPPPAHCDVPAVDGLTLTGEQQAAIDGVLEHAMAILTGGPGTGKTTVVRCIIDAFEARLRNPRILLAAPTGKAARRMSESCGREATTVHRLLEWQQDRPKRDADNPVEADLVIIDEASMLDHELAALLFRGLPDVCRIVFVGDDDQLPSVGPGRFLADCITAGVACYRLSVVQRQGRNSLIVDAAQAIRNGHYPRFATKRGADLYCLGTLTPEGVREKILTYVQRDIPQRLGIPACDIRVLIPQHRGSCGVGEINALLQQALNPPATGKAEIPLGKDACLRVGDRLLWLSNQPETGLVNGAEVILSAITGEAGNRRASITDDAGEEHEMPVHQLDVCLAYAMTVHKSQGSEYPACICVFDQSAGPHLLNRRLAYTAITRAKRLCVVLGQERSLQQAIANNRDEERRSGLFDDLGPSDCTPP